MNYSDFEAIFFPYRKKRLKELGDSGRLAHYTSAENALRIISEQRITLRSVAMMNDFSEIEHGERCLSWALGLVSDSPTHLNERLQNLLDGLAPELFNKLIDRIRSSEFQRRYDTYIFCLSEHDSEGLGATHGKLSMWRAYGGSNSVALIFKSDPIRSEAATRIFASPVYYADKESFLEEFERFVSSLEANKDRLGDFSEDDLTASFFGAFNSFILSTKHPGFDEEKEWRLIYAPWINNQAADTHVISIEGEPQEVFFFPLQDAPEDDLFGVSPNALLASAILGPMRNPVTVRNAMVREFERHGVANAKHRILISHIPLRR